MAKSNIDIAGTLCNMMEDGFNVKDSLSEKIDNSFDWGATNIVCIFNTRTKQCLCIDDGVGMGLEKLKKAITLNERSDASNSKQGKYGAGLPHALVVDTQLQGKISIISKELNSDTPLSISIDFPECVKENEYFNKPGDVTVPQNKIYLEYKIADHGTIIVEDFAVNVLSELVTRIDSCSITNSLVYELGVKYADYINDGKNIKLIVDNSEIEVKAIDPLCSGLVPVDDIQNVVCSVYVKGNEYRVLYNKKGKCGYNEIGNNKRVKFTQDADNNGWTAIQNFTVKSAYSPLWDNHQKQIIDFIENDETNDEEDNEIKQKVHVRYKFMSGVYYKRNQKCIGRINIERPTQGDEDAKKFVRDSRHQIQFPVELDTLFNVQINKSRLNEDNICQAVQMTIQQIMKDFANKMYKKYCPKKKPVAEPEQVVVEPLVVEPLVIEQVINEPLVVEPLVIEQVINEQVINEQVIIEQVIDEQVVDEQVIDEQVVDEQVVDEQVIDEQVVDEQVVVEQVIDEQVVDEQVIDEQVINEQVVEQVVDEQVINEQVVEPLVVEQVVVEPLVVEQVIDEQVVVEQVVVEPLVVEQVIDEQVVVEQVVVEQVVVEQVIDEQVVVANIRDISSFQHTTISVRHGYQLIERASEETIDTVVLMYFDRSSRDQIYTMYKYIRGINDKRNLLKEMVDKRYHGNMDVDMLGGAELVRNSV